VDLFKENQSSFQCFREAVVVHLSKEVELLRQRMLLSRLMHRAVAKIQGRQPQPQMLAAVASRRPMLVRQL
jgi:hypothetical protein